MKRYRGEPLGPNPTIAVVANDALGNYVVSTPLLQMLRSKFQGLNLHYYSGTRVQELWRKDEKIDFGFPILGSTPAASIAASRAVYDLIINLEWGAWQKCFTAAIASEDTYVCGPCLSPTGRGDWDFPDDERGDLWRDNAWIDEGLRSRYTFLTSSFMGEIFPRLAYLDGPIPLYDVPSEPVNIVVPDVLIATTASLPEKLWPTEKWLAVLNVLKDKGKTVGLLGAKPSDQKAFWRGASDEDVLANSGLLLDMRGELSLPQVVSALGKAKQVLTIDNGILHLAVAAGTPTIGLFRYAFSRIWAPPFPNLTVLTPNAGEDVEAIEVETVIDALR